MTTVADRRARLAAALAAAPLVSVSVAEQLAARIAAGIFVDGRPFAPSAVDAIALADLRQDYKTAPTSGGEVHRLYVGSELYEMELRDFDAAAGRLLHYVEALRAAAATAAASGAAPVWPPVPNLITE